MTTVLLVVSVDQRGDPTDDDEVHVVCDEHAEQGVGVEGHVGGVDEPQGHRRASPRRRRRLQKPARRAPAVFSRLRRISSRS